ncbi:hypothetical protein HDU85_003185 [Gaertneriomyces sp. JEL0708]|nr:hypothetical protein HDU85_003185 [Gaertneriomyces sp. JEL0708]
METVLTSGVASHILFSSTAGFIARCVSHPLDTLKTRIQFAAPSTTTHAEPSLRQIYSTFLSTIRNEGGPRALYKGLPVALVFSIPALSIYLGTYDYAKARLARWSGFGDEHDIRVHAVASCSAEILSGMLWTPMEVLKNTLQVQQKKAIPGSYDTWHLAKEIYRTQGVRGFFRGYFLGLGVFVPHTMTYFIAYERLKLRAAKAWGTETTTLPFDAYMLCSATAGALAAAVSNAVDIVKTRVQAGRSNSAVAVVQDMWKNEGRWRAFGKGLVARVLWVLPTVTLSMSVYEVLKREREAWLVEHRQ